MERLNLKDDLYLDKKLEKIWSERYDFENEIIAPLYQENILKNQITFLSLNPSLLPKDREKATRGFYPHSPYTLDCSKEKAEYAFFQKFYDLGKHLNQSWSTLDLLYERDSTQENLESKYNPKIIVEKDKKFIQDQIKLTFEILKELQPKVVVVSNAGADRFIHWNLKDIDIKQEFPNEKNGFIYKIDNIPFITNESRFMGSRQHWIRSEKDGRRDKLVSEILRVIE